MPKDNKKKNSKAGRIIFTLLLLVCIGVAAFAAYNLISIGLTYKAGQDEYTKLQDYTHKTAEIQDADQEDEGQNAESASQDEQQTENEKKSESTEKTEKKEKPPINVDFEALKQINPDFAGWLYLEAEGISYPVVHTEDNDFYLHRTFEKADNFAGTLFVEANNTPDFQEPNTIVYGHNMRDQSMFGKLKFLAERQDYQISDEFWIITETASYKYKMFNISFTREDSAVYTLFSGPSQEVADYIRTRAAESAVDFPLENVDENSKIVTLSTCAAANSDQRLVVQGILVGVY